MQFRLQVVKFLIKSVFSCLRFRVEFFKWLPKSSLNKGMFKCKIYILTPSELTRTRRHFCCIPRRLTLSQRHFLVSVVAHLGWLIHTDVFFPLPRHIQAKPSTQTFSSPHRTQFCPRGHLEATHLSSPHRAQSCPQRHLEASYLSHQLGAYSCPQGHLEATQRPSIRRANSCLQGHRNCARLPSLLRAHSCPQGHSEATHFSNHPYNPWSSIQFTFRLTFFCEISQIF